MKTKLVQIRTIPQKLTYNYLFYDLINLDIYKIYNVVEKRFEL